MLKHFKIVTSVILVTASSFGAVAQTENFKDVLLDGKPAKLNVKTGVITFTNGIVAKSKAAKIIKDSVKANNTIIKKNPISWDSKQDSINKEAEFKLPQTDTISNNTANFSSITNSVQNELPNNQAELKPITDIVYDVSTQLEDVKGRTLNFHKVKKGETLYAISKLYKTTLGVLKKANNLETTLIKIGQNLRVRNFESINKEQTPLWTVSKGDTLYNIAKRNNTTVVSIKSLNGLVNSLIKIGQKLLLK